MTPRHPMFAIGAIKELIEKLEAKHEEYQASNEPEGIYPYTWALWNIISALRGPDITHLVRWPIEVKRNTTMIIRKWLFDELPETYEPVLTFKQTIQCTNRHFASHIKSAEEAIQILDPDFRIFREEKDEEEKLFKRVDL